MRSAERRFDFYARLAVAADLLLAAILAGFLAGATQPTGDAMPRPLAIGLLFALPGVIGWLGLRGRRRSLLAASAALCLVASILSFALVTIVMLVPAVLFAIAAGAIPALDDQRKPRIPGGVLGPVVGGLAIAAGWALLLGFTTSGCWTTATGSGCGEGLISLPGIVVSVAAAALAVLVAAAGSPEPVAARENTRDGARPDG